MRLNPTKLMMAAVVAAGVTAAPASAQDLGLWGGWNDHGNGWKGQGQANTYLEPYDSRPAEAFPKIMDGGGRPLITPVAPRVVYFPSKEPAGTIIIDSDGKRLYYVLGKDEAFDYPISVGREGFTWTGVEKISRIAEWPDWIPPKEMLEREPRYPELMYGGIKNPLGAVALYLGSTLYRIHGTNDPKTIGQAASSGCFRMLNEHVVHLASIAKIGTVVKVLPNLDPPDAVAELPWLKKPTALGATGARSARYEQSDSWRTDLRRCGQAGCGAGGEF